MFGLAVGRKPHLQRHRLKKNEMDARVVFTDRQNGADLGWALVGRQRTGKTTPARISSGFSKPRNRTLANRTVEPALAIILPEDGNRTTIIVALPTVGVTL